MTLYYLYEVEYTKHKDGQPHTDTRYDIVESQSSLSDQEAVRIFGRVGYAVDNIVRWERLGKWFWDDDAPPEEQSDTSGPEDDLVDNHPEAFEGTDWEDR